jgi:hypothetical protein
VDNRLVPVDPLAFKMAPLPLRNPGTPREAANKAPVLVRAGAGVSS